MADAHKAGKDEDGALLAPSRRGLRLFQIYLSRYLPRHFHALRLAHGQRWAAAGQPLIVCLNHPSWWDPLICLRLSHMLAPEREHYAPIDTVAMERYGILRSLGLFPVEQGTTRGARQFLRGAMQVLGRPGAVLWLTPQGSFTDARTRPMVFRSGLDALLRSLGEATVLPLALEYTFWSERLPEALALLGEPVRLAAGDAAHPGRHVEAALAAAQDELAAFSARRDPAAFVNVFSARQGTGGIYGAWQSLRSALRGEGLRPEHSSLLRTRAADATDTRAPRP